MPIIETETRRAFRELIDLLDEVDRRWVSEEWNLFGPDDVVGAHRAVMHLLEGGIAGMFECDPASPEFRRIIEPWRKFTGDNADAIYFDAPVSSDHVYRVRGERGGAVYVSVTVEEGTEAGGMGTKTAGVLNDDGFDVDEQGRFELLLGGPPHDRNWLALSPDASRVTTRHYFEDATPAAADPAREPFLSIEVVDGPGAPPPPSEQSVAAGIRRAAEFLRSRTVGMPPMAGAENPEFVSVVPNVFPTPCRPGELGLAAFDAAYSMAPYVLGPDEALILRGRWPRCRFANVSLWTRHMQTYDFRNRSVALNRAQTQVDADGGFEMILAHRDPGLPNWLDTEGRPFGLVFWRYMLPEGAIETPTAEVVPFASLAQG